MIRFVGQRKLTFTNLPIHCNTSSWFSSQSPHLTTQQARVDFDSHAYALTLQDSIQTGDTDRAVALHCDALKRGDCLDTFASNTLLNLYVKSSMFRDARKLFDEMPDRNTVSFVTLIRALSESDRFDESLELLSRLQREGHELNGFVFTVALSLLVRMGRSELGGTVHGCCHKLGLDADAFVGSALIDAYSVCGRVDMALLVFQGIASRDMVCWTGIISCCSDNGRFEEAMRLFNKMRTVGFSPNNFTFASILKACDGLGLLNVGQSVHGYVTKSRYGDHQFVALALLELYSNSGSESDASRLFEEIPRDNDVVPWSFMISRHAQNGRAGEAVDLFVKMKRASVPPNQFTCASVSQACSTLKDLSLGKQIHCQTVKSGLDLNMFVSNATMDFYAKCGEIEDSAEIFARSENPNAITWNTLIVGFVQSGRGDEALSLFSDMMRHRVFATEVTLSSALRACAGSSSLGPGLQIHSLATKTVFDRDIAVGNAMIDMYAKCGRIGDARSVFDSMTDRDVVSWNAMISGYALHGLGAEATDLFETMPRSTRPDKLTFVGVLSACSNSGMFDRGKLYFERMTREFGIEPCVEHYTCMVGLYGRLGRVEEAASLIEEIPFEPSVMIWRALLGACVVHRATELGIATAKRVLEMDPRDDSTHVLLSNLYALSGSWHGVSQVRRTMKRTGVSKSQGLSWVETRGTIHCFSAGDCGSHHPDSRLIRGVLEWLNVETRRLGYVASRGAVLRRMEEDEKERHLWAHSERVALAFAIARTPRGSTITIIKNLRICVDCHGAIRVVSTIVKRDIVVRDLNRFHYFTDGICSCGDCW